MPIDRILDSCPDCGTPNPLHKNICPKCKQPLRRGDIDIEIYPTPYNFKKKYRDKGREETNRLIVGVIIFIGLLVIALYITGILK